MNKLFLPWTFERAFLTLLAVLLGVAFVGWVSQARLDGLLIAVFIWVVWFRTIKNRLREEEGQ